jgi:hypothetical protein
MLLMVVSILTVDVVSIFMVLVLYTIMNVGD